MGKLAQKTSDAAVKGLKNLKIMIGLRWTEIICLFLAVFFLAATIATFSLELILMGGASYLGSYSRDDAAGDCHCIAECVHGAGTVDLSKTSYGEDALWANGYYLTHDPFNAAGFISYANYVQSIGAFHTPGTNVPKLLPVPTQDKWAEGTDYECTFDDYMNGHPLVVVSRGIGNYDPMDCYQCVDDLEQVHYLYINTEFYRYTHEQYARSLVDDASVIVTTGGEHDYIQAMLDANRGVNYSSLGAEAIDWVDYPEISSTYAMFFCKTYEYACEHKDDGTETDYESMVNNLSAYAKWFYNGEGDGNEGNTNIAELSQSKYYGYAGHTIDETNTSGYVFEPAYSKDTVYQAYYESWVARYGESPESLADMIYYIMRDNKRLGVNTVCDKCKNSYVECTGSSWWLDYQGLFTFIEHNRIGFEYQDLNGNGIPDCEEEDYVDEHDPDLYSGGNNVGQAPVGEEYVIHIDALMDENEGYYGYPMTAGAIGGTKNNAGANVVAHTVVDGKEYLDGQTMMFMMSDNQLHDCNPENDAHAIISEADAMAGTGMAANEAAANCGCPIFSMAGALSNVLGTPITLIQILDASDRFEYFCDRGDQPIGKLKAPSSGGDGWYYRRPWTNYGSGTSGLDDFCKQYDASFTSRIVGTTEEAFEALCDTTKNTVIRTHDPYGYDGMQCYGWAGNPKTWVNAEHYNHLPGNGHLYYIVKAYPETREFLVCMNYGSFAYAKVSIDDFPVNRSYLILQTDKRSGGSNYSGTGTRVVDVDGYPNPTDIETGRTDMSLLEASGVDVGPRRFDGSWYTYINGWEQGTDATAVQVSDKSLDLYSSPPYNPSDFGNCYFFDYKYYEKDMQNWLKATEETYGYDFSSRQTTTMKTLIVTDNENNGNAIVDGQGAWNYYTTLFPEWGDVWNAAGNNKAKMIAAKGYSEHLPLFICAQPWGALSGPGGQPISDSWWEKYADVSGLYATNGLFAGAGKVSSGGEAYGNECGKSYHFPCMAVLKDSSGKIWYVPVVYNSAKGHGFPFSAGQSHRRVTLTKLDDINDMNSVISWVWADSGVMDSVTGGNYDKNTGTYAKLTDANGVTHTAPAGCLGVTNLDNVTCFSTLDDYFSWISTGTTHNWDSPLFEALNLEMTSVSKTLVDSMGYEIQGFIVCSYESGAGASTGYEYDPSNPGSNRIADSNTGNNFGINSSSMLFRPKNGTATVLLQNPPTTWDTLTTSVTSSSTKGSANASTATEKGVWEILYYCPSTDEWLITEDTTKMCMEIRVYKPYNYSDKEIYPVCYIKMGNNGRWKNTSTNVLYQFDDAIERGDMSPTVIVLIEGYHDQNTNLFLGTDTNGDGKINLYNIMEGIQCRYAVSTAKENQYLIGFSYGSIEIDRLAESDLSNFAVVGHVLGYDFKKRAQSIINGTLVTDYILIDAFSGGEKSTDASWQCGIPLLDACTPIQGEGNAYCMDVRSSCAHSHVDAMEIVIDILCWYS